MPQEHKFILEIRSKGFEETKKKTNAVEGSIKALRQQVSKHKSALDGARVGTDRFRDAEKRLEQSTKQLDKALKRVTGKVAGYNASAKSMRGVTSGLRRSIGAFRNNLLLISFTFGAVIASISKFVKAARQFEDVKTRLVGLTGSVKGAEKAFNKFNQVAATTPFSLADVVEAGAQLQAFGGDAEDLIKTVTDLAAFMGTTATEAANAFGRALSGPGAADVLRERGILNMVKMTQGISDLSKTTLPEFREALIKTMQDPAIGIAGSTDRLSKTFTGAMSNMGDSALRASASFGELLIKVLKLQDKVAFLKDTFDFLGKGIQDLVDTPVESLKRKFDELGWSTDSLEGRFNDLKGAQNDLDFEKQVSDVEDMAFEFREFDFIVQNFERTLGFMNSSSREFTGTWQDLEEGIEGAMSSLRQSTTNAIAEGDLETANAYTNQILKLKEVLEGFSGKGTEVDAKLTWKKGKSTGRGFRMIPKMVVPVEFDFDPDMVDNMFVDDEFSKKTFKEMGKQSKEAMKQQANMEAEMAQRLLDFEDFKRKLGKSTLEKAIMNLEKERNEKIAAAQLMIDDEEVKNAKILEIKEKYSEAINALEDDDAEKSKQRREEIHRMLLAQFEAMTSSFQANLDARVKAEVSTLKESEQYKNADTERRKDMEREVRKQFQKEQMLLFRFDQSAAIASIGMDTSKAIMKAVALMPPSGGFMTPMIATMGAMQAGAVLAQKPPAFAKGGDFITSGPQMILVGDNVSGRERVTISPSEQNPSLSHGGSVTVNISGNVMSENYTRDQIIPQIKDALRFDLA
jgi:hypothetical protein